MRLDTFLVDQKLISSRSRAQMLIANGDVFVDGKTARKSSQNVSDNTQIAINDSIKYVSRAGLKLESALKAFSVDPYKKHCLDIGSSTGGFTDVLLQKGAASIVAVDVGTGQMESDLAASPKVSLFEQTDIRDFYLQKKFDLIVMDVSFISQIKLIKHIERFSKEKTSLISLIKPQFEVGEGFIGRGGIVKDAKRTQEIISNIITTYENNGFVLRDKVIPSVIRGGDGNIEYVAHFQKN